MKLKKKGSEIFVPDCMDVEEAIKRTTCMSIAAHQDDIEIMSYDGIAQCFGRDDKWFFGVVVTNGAGSPREGLYAGYTDDEMQKVRNVEQKKAAYVGEYGAMAMMNYGSSEVKDPKNPEVADELKELIALAAPDTVYTHNLADKHDTHVALAVRTINAIRQLPKHLRPKKLYGCEVWRSLDWMNDSEKVLFDLSAHPNIAASVLGVHDSQICGGKRYDLAAAGRRLANATFSESHGVDTTTAMSYAMDLTPLIIDDQLDINEYVQGYIDRFSDDVSKRLKKII